MENFNIDFMQILIQGLDINEFLEDVWYFYKYLLKSGLAVFLDYDKWNINTMVLLIQETSNIIEIYKQNSETLTFRYPRID